MPPSRKRRTYLVDRSFQLKYALVLAGWGVLLSVLFGLWIWQAHEHVAQLAIRARAIPGAIERTDRLLLWMVAVIALLSSAALGLVGFLMSHRIAGPVYVMGRDLRLLAQGHFPEHRPLRKGDELKALFELFRHAVDALRSREERRTAMLEGVVADLRAAGDGPPGIAKAIAALEAEIRDRRGALQESEREDEAAAG